jgi:signal transduction histidine kinase
MEKVPQPVVLYLDDEKANLDSFYASFRRDFKIFTAIHQEEAIKVLNENTVQVIIADQRMPGITGVEFFEKIKLEFPDPIRILLTGYADINVVIDSINKGQVFRFIDKPWDNHAVYSSIKSAIELYDTKQELSQKQIQLNAALEEIDKFIYSISHDVRAPLVSVMGLAHMGKEENKSINSPVLEEIFSHIESSIGRLDLFINNLLNYFRNRKVNLEYTFFDVKDIITGISERLAISHFQKAIEFNYLSQMEGKVYSDPVRWNIILYNVILNAFVFADANKNKRTVDVNVSCNDEYYEVTVSDNGVGILPEVKEKIFQLFYRGHSNSMGAGIGLYIAKETMVKLNGTIEIESVPGLGTSVHLRFPIRQQKN